MTTLLESMPRPTARMVLLGAGPRFARDAFGPVAAFYVGWKVAGLAVGIGAATAVALLAHTLARREDRTANLAKLSLGFVVVQAVIGLASGSERVYLAQPVLLSGALGVAFLASAFTRRPIIGVFAQESYPFPREVVDSDTFRSVFARASIAWGVYQIARAIVRMMILVNESVDVYVAVNFLTGAPLMVAMFGWTFWYTSRGLARSDELQAPASADAM